MWDWCCFVNTRDVAVNLVQNAIVPGWKVYEFVEFEKQLLCLTRLKSLATITSVSGFSFIPLLIREYSSFSANLVFACGGMHVAMIKMTQNSLPVLNGLHFTAKYSKSGGQCNLVMFIAVGH